MRHGITRLLLRAMESSVTATGDSSDVPARAGDRDRRRDADPPCAARG
jgi:hypothetical protein